MNISVILANPEEQDECVLLVLLLSSTRVARDTPQDEGPLMTAPKT
jgi:hypothetical protein